MTVLEENSCDSDNRIDPINPIEYKYSTKDNLDTQSEILLQCEIMTKSMFKWS